MLAAWKNCFGEHFFGDTRHFFVIKAKQNRFLPENIFNNVTVRRIVVAMNTVSVSTGLFTEIFLWYLQNNFNQTKRLGRCQPIVEVGAAVYGCLYYITKLKAINCYDVVSKVSIGNFKDH